MHIAARSLRGTAIVCENRFTLSLILVLPAVKDVFPPVCCNYTGGGAY